MKKGFTLVELLVTIVIIALLGGMGIISYNTFFDAGKEKYHSTIESSILLAGSDYFLDHRDILPVENMIKTVSLADLINDKYIEPIKDSKGNLCTDGYVSAYRKNNKYVYDVCMKCDDGYESSGCNTKYSSQIEITAYKHNGDIYIATTSYNNVEYTNDDVTINFKMNKEYFNVSRYDVIDTSNQSVVLTSCNTNSENMCTVPITITKSGTYEVRAYDSDNNLIASNQQFNVRITRNAPKFDIKGKKYFELTKTECNDNITTKDMTFKIIRKDINDEYNKVKYCVNRVENPNDCNQYSSYQDNGESLTININKGSGAYVLNVIITNFAGDGKDYPERHEFYVAYAVDLEYEDDNSTSIHKVVKGQNYNYLSTKYSEIIANGDTVGELKVLPTRKRAYGVDNMEIRWHLASEKYADAKRITGTTIVQNNCTYKIKGLMSIPIDKPGTGYCTNPTYNENSQSLTKTMDHVTFLNKDQVNAGEYTVGAKIDAPLYIWKDDYDYDNKSIKCSMKKAENSITLNCNSLTYNGSDQNLLSSKSASGGSVYISTSKLTSSNYSSTGGTAFNKAQGNGAGNYTVYAYTPGNINYKEKSGSKSCSIDKANNSITLSCDSLTYNGSNQNLLSSKSASGGDVYISTSNLTSSNYSSTGGKALNKAQGKNPGNYTVYAYTPGNANYKEKSGSKSCSIGKITCSNCYVANSVGTACVDTTKPSANSVESLTFGSSYVEQYCAAGTTICGLGNDTCATSLKLMYRLSCMNSWKSAAISNGCASISFTSAEANSSSCSKPSLRYYLEDESGNQSDEQTVNDIGLRLIIAQTYNYLINRNATNTSVEIGYWTNMYNNNSSIADIQRSIIDLDEPKNYYNSLSVSNFIKREFKGILGRDAEDAAITSHTGSLESMGNNRPMHLSNAIIDSEEAGKIRQCWSYTAASSTTTSYDWYLHSTSYGSVNYCRYGANGSGSCSQACGSKHSCCTNAKPYNSMSCSEWVDEVVNGYGQNCYCG